MNIPMIRLEVEGLKYSVIHAFSERTGHLAEEVAEQVDKALNEFDWDRAIKSEINSVLEASIHRTIENYFTFGEGRRLIEERIESVLPGFPDQNNKHNEAE